MAFQSMTETLSHEDEPLDLPFSKLSHLQCFTNSWHLLREYCFGQSEYLFVLLLKLMMFPYIKIYSDQYLQYYEVSGGVVARALASHQCGLGLISRLGVICGSSLLL